MRKLSAPAWIVIGLVIFALGYIGTRMAQDYQNQKIQSGPPPSLPSPTK